MLPLVAMLPLWFRFLQTLQQAYDTGKRWPYLGNAFKYFTAGLVVLYGMTHAAGERGVGWVVGFGVTTVYQIVWDAVIDWELLVVVPRDGAEWNGASMGSSSFLSSPLSFFVPGWIGPWVGSFFHWRCPSFISSLSPRLYPSRLLGCIVLPFRKRISQPIANLCRRGRDAMPRWNQIRLRPQRLFDDDSFYWRALFINAALRCCWMMSFIPAYRVSILDGTTQETFEGGSQSWLFVILGALEIVRRCIWGIIKVELETIKLTNGGENDLAMASTADEYLREGKWNAWHKSNVVENNVGGAATSMESDLELVDSTNTRRVRPGSTTTLTSSSSKGQYLPLDGIESGIFSKSSMDSPSPKQTHRWLGLSVSNGFLRWAYFVELALWPCSFLVASYYVISIE